MFIDDYYSESGGTIRFSREQGSDFAKRVAEDFNPLHDVDTRRFCVPGDLLFAVVLLKYGVSQRMKFVFSGMVDDAVELVLPEPAAELRIADSGGREYLRVERAGELSRDAALVENLVRSYVAFSGQTFPHILEPLLSREKVMLNPQRPMVIYESMAIELDRLDISAPTLAGGRNSIEIDGKRGSVRFAFNFEESGEVVGRGGKRMRLSGLREYDGEAVAAAVTEYNTRKVQFLGNRSAS